MKWFAYRHNINTQEIEPFNIFDHAGFRSDIERYLKTCKDKEDFAERVKSSLMYYYWSRSEWEIIISPWCGGRHTQDRKIDVYSQVALNWEHFIEYLWRCYDGL